MTITVKVGKAKTHLSDLLALGLGRVGENEIDGLRFYFHRRHVSADQPTV